MKINLYWTHFTGRTDLPPIPRDPMNPDVIDKGSIIAFYPFDIRGFAGVRIRYLDVKKADEFITYIPALRRVRRMSGSDTQDPLLGSDVPWEDWMGYWQRISAYIWKDVTFELLGKEVILAPSPSPRVPTYSYKYCLFLSPWELKPCYKIQVNIGDPRYMYSKRILWIDMTTGRMAYCENYDKRGRLWRDYIILHLFHPEDGNSSIGSGECLDHVNSHKSGLKFNTTINNPLIGDDYFNLRFLTKMAR